MKTITINKHKIKHYTSIDDMPIGRWNEFNVQLMYDSSIGETVEALNARIASAISFLNVGKTADANIELRNLMATYFSIEAQQNYMTRALICMIHSIDDEPVDDLNYDGISENIEKLKKMNIPIGTIREMVLEQKKN